MGRQAMLYFKEDGHAKFTRKSFVNASTYKCQGLADRVVEALKKTNSHSFTQHNDSNLPRMMSLRSSLKQQDT